jgi:hypothetical protein
MPSAHPHPLTCSVRVLTVLLSPPQTKAPSDQRRCCEPSESRSREGPDPGPNDRVHHQVFRCFLRPAPDKASDRSPEDRTSLRPRPVEGEVGAGMVCPSLDDRWPDLPPAGSFALHRGHRAGVVPALAHVFLVRRVTSVLAAVVAAELLAWLDLASAPHVLAVHPTSHSSPALRR